MVRVIKEFKFCEWQGWQSEWLEALPDTLLNTVQQNLIDQLLNIMQHTFFGILLPDTISDTLPNASLMPC